MSVELWQQCVEVLRDELPSQQFNTWIRPLQVEMHGDELRVYAPNRFVLDWVNEKYIARLSELMNELGGSRVPAISLLIGSRRPVAPPPPPAPVPAPVASRPQPQPEPAPSTRSFDLMEPEAPPAETPVPSAGGREVQVEGGLKHTTHLNPLIPVQT